VVVRGLDAISGTPVLDLKPYVPVLDRREGDPPEWVDRLMEGYF
jgi:tRNA (Thr-GGU) A37 N-methylase